MKKLLLSVSLFAGTMMTLSACAGTETVETIDTRPVIHFDAASIISSARDHHIKMLTLSSIPRDDVNVPGAVEELQGMQADNDTYLAELEGLQHEYSAADEYKDLVVEYLEAENAYIDQTIENVHAGSISLPSRFSMDTLYSRTNAKVSEFRYEPK
ncbi:hypothetical protein [Exiguobacterium aurantiacum]|uniref:Uncharacterized protein n=1 Tax=Exiguobacterium aurantiacum TaxID=33987 RepID=A0ABY5FL47_9BACL|nr:hypothetical protein [Exiguobacterium aurantiacum]UTT42124.1 hypothetical protein NMQ00_11225 [Exiguobacterium aurantiacum]